MPLLTFKATNFRKLRRFSWSPDGVSVIVGSNGAGKTTVLDLLRFLRGMFVGGSEFAFRAAGGGDHFLSRGTEPGALVALELCVGDIRWLLRLPMSDAGLKGTFGEELYQGDRQVLRAAAYSETWYLGTTPLTHDDDRCCAKRLWDRGEAGWMRPLYDALYDLRTYDFWLHTLKEGTTREDANQFLHSTGKNLWAVLANWKQAPMRFRGQFDWVMIEARRAFPDLIENIEFDRNEAFLFPPGATDPADGLPPRRQPDGLLTGLLQLTALAGAKPGSIVAFDEMENQLHPHAIRSILSAMRAIAEERDLTVLLTTHSPVLMNEFADVPGNIYVLDRDRVENPVPLDQLRDPAWLSMFSLGDLYDRMRFASPDVNQKLR